MSDFDDIPLIDAHIHMRTVASISNQTNVMNACGLAAVNALASAVLGGLNINQNVLVALLKAQGAPRVYGFGGLHHRGPAVDAAAPDFAGQLRRIRELGLDGVKMLEGKPSVYKELGTPLNDPLYDGFYALLTEWQFPLLLHVGDPAMMWDRRQVQQWALDRGWFYGDGTYPTLEQLYTQVEDVLARYPDLPLILAHFAFLAGDIDRCAGLLDRWANLSFDLTPGWGMFAGFSSDPAAWHDFFVRYSDRILFGTDNSGGRTPDDPEKVDIAGRRIAAMRRCLEQTGEVAAFGPGSFRGLGLPADVLAKVYHGNFRRYAGDVPHPVNLPVAIRRCRELIAIAEAADTDDETRGDLAAIAEGLEAM